MNWQNGVTPINETNMNNISFEYGTNANGRYYKYGDGTLICCTYQTLVFGFTNQESWANGYSSGQIALADFPVEFTNVPIITGSVKKASGQWGGMWTGVFQNSTSTNPGTVEFIRGTSTPADAVTYVMQYIAIGRWKN